MKQQLTGTLKAKTVNAGSKSEHTAVVLELDDGTEHRLRVIGDNPFQNDTLKPFVGHRVTVNGQMSDTGAPVFIVGGIQDILFHGPGAPPATKKSRGGKGPKM